MNECVSFGFVTHDEKVVASDALITDAAFGFDKRRSDESNTYIKSRPRHTKEPQQ